MVFCSDPQLVRNGSPSATSLSWHQEPESTSGKGRPYSSANGPTDVPSPSDFLKVLEIWGVEVCDKN